MKKIILILCIPYLLLSHNYDVDNGCCYADETIIAARGSSDFIELGTYTIKRDSDLRALGEDYTCEDHGILGGFITYKNGSKTVPPGDSILNPYYIYGYWDGIYGRYLSYMTCGCTKPDKPFPDLNETQEAVLFWSSSEDNKSNECRVDYNGTVQAETINCQPDFRCVVEKKECNEDNKTLPEPAENERVVLEWNEENDESQKCLDLNGTVKEGKVNCKAIFQCVQKTDSPPTVCPEHISSYVTPRDRLFHEEISLDGLAFGLHYRSADFNATNNLAKGWSLENHHAYVDGKLHLGSGTVLVATASSTEGENRLFTLGGDVYVFDASLKHIETRDAYTKKTLFSFAYENEKLVSISDEFDQTTSLTYDADGVLSSIVAPHGQTTAFDVDENGDLLEVQYEDGSSYAFEYDNHLMTKETEPKGNVFLHIFDAEGKVTKVIDAEQGEWSFNNESTAFGTKTVQRASGDTVRYRNYSVENGMLKFETIMSSGEVITTLKAVDDSQESQTSCGVTKTQKYKMANGKLVRDPINQRRVLESVTTKTPSGLTKELQLNKAYKLNANGKLERLTLSSTLNGKTTTSVRDYVAHSATQTTALGKVNQVQYGADDALVQWSKAYGLHKTNYTYDNEGRVTKVTQGDRSTHYVYDARGNLKTTTDAKGQSTNYEYDSRDRLVKTIYPNGNSIQNSYDKNGNMTVLTTPTPSEHTFTYNGVNKRVSMKSPLHAQTTYEYDKARRIIAINRPSGKSINNTYTDGQLSSTQTDEGTTDYTYACQGAVATKTNGSEELAYEYDGTLLKKVSQTGALEQSMEFAYNNDFSLSSFSYAGASTNYDYNDDHEPTKIGDYDIVRSNENKNIEVSDGTYTQTTKLNAYGEVEEQNSGNFAYALEHNKNGQIVKKTESIANKKVIYAYEYDTQGRLTTVKSTAGAVASLGENLLNNPNFENLDDNELPTDWHPYGVNTTKESSSDAHSGDVSVKITNEQKGNSAWRGKNIAINHAKVLTFSGWSKAQDVSANALYALDFRVSFADGSYKWYYGDTKFSTGTHDWQEIKITTQFDKPVVSVRPYVLLYRGTGTVWFDDISVQEGGVVADGLLNGNFETVTGDSPVGWSSYNNPSNKIDQTEKHSGAYSVKITNETVKNAGWRSKSFKVNNAKTITFKGWSKAQDVSANALYALDFRVTFDDGSYLWYYNDSKFATGTHDWEQIDLTKTFNKPVTNIKAYVLLYRGTGTVWFDDIEVIVEDEQEAELKVVESYTYDKNSNRATATVNGKTIESSYTLDDQLEVYGDNTYRYDNDGYLNEKTTPNGTTTYEYGTLGELKKVVTHTSTGSATTIEYKHNANNQRVAKLINGEVVEKYLWANLTTLLAIYDKDDNLIQRFEYANNRMPTNMTSYGQKYYLHYDQVGTLKAVSDKNLRIIKEITYDTYGNILSDSNPSFKVPFGFAGGLYDADTKLTRFGYRDYDAYTGKWTAKDPIDFGGGDSNLYGYVLQDPIRFVDTNGLLPFDTQGATSLRYWVDRAISTGNGLYYVPAGFAALWTPETSTSTAMTLFPYSRVLGASGKAFTKICPADKIMRSKAFGVGSKLFGNKYARGTPGIFNKPGSSFKIGWSGDKAYRGGGSFMRIGYGGANGNQAIKHIPLPWTFVPDDIANIIKTEIRNSNGL